MTVKFSYKEESGIYRGDMFAAVRLNTSQPGRILSRIVEVAENSDFYPMVKSVSRRVHNGQDFFVVHMWSESDSLPYLKQRFETAFDDFQERIEAALPVTVQSGETVEECIEFIVGPQPAHRRPAWA